MTALVTNLDETDEYGLPTQADRDFYRRLIGTWIAALRGYGAQSFETYDIVFVRDRCIQELMTAHRAIINTGQQQSPTTLKAALEAAWSTHTPLDFTKVMQDLLTWERNGRSDDKAAAAKRHQLRVASSKHDAGNREARRRRQLHRSPIQHWDRIIRWRRIVQQRAHGLHEEHFINGTAR